MKFFAVIFQKIEQFNLGVRSAEHRLGKLAAGLGRGGARRSSAIEDDVERALGDNFGIELIERTGGGVARVGEHFLAGGFALGIQFFKACLGHENFAADFEHGRDAFH